MMVHDVDGFNRFDAASRFGMKSIMAVVEQLQAGVAVENTVVAEKYVEAMVATLDAYAAFEAASSLHLMALMLRLPSDVELLNELAAKVCGWGVYCCDFLLLPITSYYS